TGVQTCALPISDRGREITIALTQQEFPEYQMKPLSLHYVTMTAYDETFKNVQVIFQKENLTQTLGQTLAEHNKTQVRIAETEKSEEHTSELQSRENLVCRLLLEKKK